MRRKTKDLRICRVLPAYPHSGAPGGGLPAYYLSKYISFPTLHIARRIDEGIPWPLPPHVCMRFVSYPDVIVGNRVGFDRIMARVLKGLGQIVLAVRSLLLISRFSPDLVHIHSLLSLPLAILVKILLRIPVVLTFHGTDFVYFERSSFLQKLSHLIDTVCYVSSHMQPTLQEVFPDKRIVYTPSGVNLSVFRPLNLKHQPVILMVGSLKWEKGYEYALLSLKAISNKYPQYRLAIIGDGPLKMHFQSLAQELGIGDRVDFMGIQPRAKVVELLNKARLFLLSSISEGMPKVLLEALACGTPIVCTDVGACRDIIKDRGGVLVPPKDPERLAHAMDKVLSNPQLRRQFSMQGPQIAKRYDWQLVAKKVQELYCSMAT